MSGFIGNIFCFVFFWVGACRNRDPPVEATGAPTATPPPDCMTFGRNAYVDDAALKTAVRAFCDSHTGDDICCSGDAFTCDRLFSQYEYTFCKGSCRGDSSCENLGADSAGDTPPPLLTFNFGVNSCDGEQACYDIALGGFGCVVQSLPAVYSFGEGSCRGRQACYNMANYAEKGMTIGAGSCLGEQACEEIYGGTGGVTIGAGSCTVAKACKSIVNDDTFFDLTIEGGACTSWNGVDNQNCNRCLFTGDPECNVVITAGNQETVCAGIVGQDADVRCGVP